MAYTHREKVSPRHKIGREIWLPTGSDGIPSDALRIYLISHEQGQCHCRAYSEWCKLRRLVRWISCNNHGEEVEDNDARYVAAVESH